MHMRNFCASASYRISELKVLNELDYPVWISTYQPEDTHFLWANDAALCLWKAPTLEAFVSTDLVSKRSAAVATIHDELFNDVQASNEKCPQPRAASPRQSPYSNDKRRSTCELCAAGELCTLEDPLPR